MKIEVHRRNCWLMYQETPESPLLIRNFETAADRGVFCRGVPKIYGWTILYATDAIVRKINRRLAAGENLTFPIEI